MWTSTTKIDSKSSARSSKRFMENADKIKLVHGDLGEWDAKNWGGTLSQAVGFNECRSRIMKSTKQVQSKSKNERKASCCLKGSDIYENHIV